MCKYVPPQSWDSLVGAAITRASGTVCHDWSGAGCTKAGHGWLGSGILGHTDVTGCCVNTLSFNNSQLAGCYDSQDQIRHADCAAANGLPTKVCWSISLVLEEEQRLPALVPLQWGGSCKLSLPQLLDLCWDQALVINITEAQASLWLSCVQV